MGDKYVVREEMDIWGNDRLVVRRTVSADDVAGIAAACAAMLASTAVHRYRSWKEDTFDREIEKLTKLLVDGRYEEALSSVDRMFAGGDQTQRLMGAFLKAGIMTDYLGLFAEAISVWNAAMPQIEVHLNDTEYVGVAYGRRGQCYHQAGNLQAAISDFTTAIRLRPQGAFGYCARGIALVDLGELAQALNDFNRAITIDPAVPAHYENRARAYRGLGETEKGIDDLSKAIKLEPGGMRLYRQRADLYLQLGRRREAIDDLSKAISIDLNWAPYYLARAEVYMSVPDYVRAEADYTSAARLDPNLLGPREGLQKLRVLIGG